MAKPMGACPPQHVAAFKKLGIDVSAIPQAKLDELAAAGIDWQGLLDKLIALAGSPAGQFIIGLILKWLGLPPVTPPAPTP